MGSPMDLREALIPCQTLVKAISYPMWDFLTKLFVSIRKKSSFEKE
jgi:hypothetical protein